MNKKIQKLRVERAKNDEKVAELLARNKEIDDEITELENTDIIGIVRESGFTPDELAELIQKIKKNPASVLSKEEQNET